MRETLPLISVRIAILSLLAVSMFVASGCGHSGDPAKTVSADAAPRAAVVKVRRAPISNTLSIAGEFLPYQEVELHAKVAGYIKNINVDIGDRVRTGQVLAVLEIPELSAQLQGAGAGVRHSQEEITRAQNEVSRARGRPRGTACRCYAIEAGIGCSPWPDRGTGTR